MTQLFYRLFAVSVAGTVAVELASCTGESLERAVRIVAALSVIVTLLSVTKTPLSLPELPMPPTPPPMSESECADELLRQTEEHLRSRIEKDVTNALGVPPVSVELINADEFSVRIVLARGTTPPDHFAEYLARHYGCRVVVE